jgi:hypothetical protein
MAFLGLKQHWDENTKTCIKEGQFSLSEQFSHCNNLQHWSLLHCINIFTQMKDNFKCMATLHYGTCHT